MGDGNNIPDGWMETTLGEVALIGSSKRIFFSEYVDKGIPFYRSKEIIQKQKGNNISTELFITDKKYDNLKKNFGAPKENDILLTSVGTLGIPYRVKKNEIFYFKDGNLTWFRDYQNIESAFLYNWFLSSTGKHELNKITIGSTQSALTISGLKSIEILLPPIKEQISITNIINSFDDKIELLQAQNKTLETIAKTIFKEWFGKYQIGDELPEGWRVDSLSEIADFLNGLALQKYPPKKGYETLPVIKIRELKQGITSNTDRANTELDEKYIIDSGDVLFSWSGSLEVVIWQYGKGALNQHLFKVSSEIYPKWFYYHWVLHHLKEFKKIASSKATTMGHINRKHLDLAEVIIPDKETFKKLNFLFSPILEKIENNQNLIQSLTKTRDTLLPKLMSGQVRVNNITQTADA